MGEGTVLMRKGALGDVVLLASVTGQIRGPLTVITDPRYAQIAEALPGVDRVVPWPGVGEPGRRIDLQGGLRGLRAAPWSRHLRKHSLRRRLRLWGLPLAPRPSVPVLYGRAVGVVPSDLPWIELPSADRDVLALAPGAAWSPKQWSLQGFSAVGRAWDGPVVVLGGPGEQGLITALTREIPGAIGVCETGFAETLRWCARIRVMVAGDTGLMHLAGATGAHVVALFGPTHPDDGFWVYPGVAVQQAVPCRPCALHRVPSCHKGHHRCMAHPVAQVLAAVRQCAG